MKSNELGSAGKKTKNSKRVILQYTLTDSNSTRLHYGVKRFPRLKVDNTSERWPVKSGTFDSKIH